MTFSRTPAGGQGDLNPPMRPRFSSVTQEPEPQAEMPSYESEVRQAPSFDPRTSPTPPEKCANVIAQGSRWKGNLSIQDSVRIDGQLSGEIDAKGTVHIAEGALVEAKIKAAFVVVSGSFKGEIRCSERLELMPKSKVQGDLLTKVLNVHEGAIVDGSIRMSAEKADGRDAGERETRAEAREAREARGNGSRPVAVSED